MPLGVFVPQEATFLGTRGFPAAIRGNIVTEIKLLNSLYSPSFHFIFHVLFHLIFHYRAIIYPKRIALYIDALGGLELGWPRPLPKGSQVSISYMVGLLD